MKNTTAEPPDEQREYYRIIKIFDTLAPFYNLVVLPLSGLREKVVNFANPEKGSKILDVGTGTGKQAFAFAKKGYSVTGVDLSEPMIRIANKKNRYKNTGFEVADATNLPYPDNTFDLATISFTLHTMPPEVRQKVVREMVRVTRTSGSIVIVDFALPGNKLGKYLVYDLVKGPMGRYFIGFTHSDLKGLLRESGIEVKSEMHLLLDAVKVIKGRKII